MTRLDAKWAPLVWTLSALLAVGLLALTSTASTKIFRLRLLHPIGSVALAGILTAGPGAAIWWAWPRTPERLLYMPQRTNEKQEIIALLRRNLARKGCTVSESRMLTDTVTGVQRRGRRRHGMPGG